MLQPQELPMASNNNLTKPVPNHVDLCFTRIGDARYLYATLIKMRWEEDLRTGKKSVDMLIHDIRPQAAARNLVIFKLLGDCITMIDGHDSVSGTDGIQWELLFHTIYYTYCAATT